MTMCENNQTSGDSIAVVWVGVAIWVAVKRVQDGHSADVGGGYLVKGREEAGTFAEAASR